MGKEEMHACRLGVRVDDLGDTVEVAGEGRAALALKVVIEGVGGVGEPGVGVPAGRPGLDGAAVGHVSARVVQRRLQPLLPHLRLGHTQSVPLELALGRP